MIVDTDKVFDDKPWTGVEIDRRSSEGDALDHLGDCRHSGGTGTLGQLDGEELGYSCSQAVADYEQGVLGHLLQLRHQGVKRHRDDVGAGLRHPLVCSALVKWNIVAIEIHQDICYTRYWEHLQKMFSC